MLIDIEAEETTERMGKLTFGLDAHVSSALIEERVVANATRKRHEEGFIADPSESPPGSTKDWTKEESLLH